MNDRTKETRVDWGRRIAWAIYFLGPILLLFGMAFVGFVKFMAWWRVAFGDCTP